MIKKAIGDKSFYGIFVTSKWNFLWKIYHTIERRGLSLMLQNSKKVSSSYDNHPT